MKHTLAIKLGAYYDRAVKCLVFAIKGFSEDQCVLRASALTLYTLLSIVPVMAMAFGIAKGFGMQKLLEKELYARFPGQEEVINNVITFSNNLLEGTKSGLMALLGVMILLYSVVKMFNHIENAFNTIWWVKEGRTWVRKFTDYLALFITAPLLTLFSGSATIFISTQLEAILNRMKVPGSVELLISMGFKAVPFLTIWALFVCFYIFIPNRKIDVKAALAGGIIAGSIYQIGQILYLKFQVGVSHYNAIYGSFAALPLFLVWLQASWIILLVGAEIAFAWENIQVLEARNLDYDAISIRLKKLMLLRIVLVCVHRFANRQPAPTDIQIYEETRIPLQIVKRTLSDLIDCRILSEVKLKASPGYAPAHDIDTMTLSDVIESWENHGDRSIQVADTLEYQALEKSLEGFKQAIAQSGDDRRIKEI
ncbi:MAG: YihY/virulence factor BrkB family protein [Desulfobacteraceae bacterium]|nr:MAG: YihY/virulence factor BrkB family protein [Desulfobacteraceae bacterium]